MNKRRKPFFHPDGRTSAADISRYRQQFLHVQHLDAFVAGRLRGGFQVDLGIAGNHAHQNPVAIAAQHQRLGTPGRPARRALRRRARRPDSLRPPGKGSTRRRSSPVEQAGGIGFIDFYGHGLRLFRTKVKLIRRKSKTGVPIPVLKLYLGGCFSPSTNL